ncbi:MAG: methyltransferase domain-containing protein [Mesorhizobium sp.]|nr:methyltransferase domain-containing protein [Mesorhizobium sp.]MCO5162271.1 methyltransferase domain-containing protein [Mesorhizobium sp.]
MEPIIDTDLATRRKLRALARPVPGAGFLLDRAAEDLADRIAAVARRFPRAATLYSHGDAAARSLLSTGKVDEIVEIVAHGAFAGASGARLAAPETVPLEPASLDLIVSLMALHEVNDLPGLLIQARRALKPDGLFVAAFPGAGTLAELRDSLLAAEIELTGGASPRILPFADVRDAGALLQRAGLALPVADIETVTVRYDSMFALMRDLRAMGATNTLLARLRKPARRALFLRAAELYAERFSDPDGRVRATFATIWLSGWAPAPSQQKPLRPGSAKLSLAKALGDLE